MYKLKNVTAGTMSFQLINIRQVTNLEIDTMVLNNLITDH